MQANNAEEVLKVPSQYIRLFEGTRRKSKPKRPTDCSIELKMRLLGAFDVVDAA